MFYYEKRRDKNIVIKFTHTKISLFFEFSYILTCFTMTNVVKLNF